MYGVHSNARGRRNMRDRDALAKLETVVLLTMAVALVIAAAGHHEPAAVPTQPHQVRAGETLWALAERYKSTRETTQDALARMIALNGLESAQIAPGDVILVPMKDELMTAQAKR